MNSLTTEAHIVAIPGWEILGVASGATTKYKKGQPIRSTVITTKHMANSSPQIAMHAGDVDNPPSNRTSRWVKFCVQIPYAATN